MIETRRDIHLHPELGFREKRTAALIADGCAHSSSTRSGPASAKTGVVGILKGGRPGRVVAVRADMDALPIPELIDVPYKSTVENVKHACGHDGHVAVALGVAELLSRAAGAGAGHRADAVSASRGRRPRRRPYGCAADARRRAVCRSEAERDLRNARDADDRRRHDRPEYRACHGQRRSLHDESSARKRTARIRTPASIRSRSPRRSSWRCRPSPAGR